MPPEFLTKELFQSEMKRLNERLDDALALREDVQATDTRVAVLEDRSERWQRLLFSSLAGTVLALVVSFLAYLARAAK